MTGPRKGSSDWWRDVASLSADLAFRVSEYYRTERQREDREYDPSALMDTVARAAEYCVTMKVFDRTDEFISGAGDMLDTVARYIAEGTHDGWESARLADRRCQR